MIRWTSQARWLWIPVIKKIEVYKKKLLVGRRHPKMILVGKVLAGLGVLLLLHAGYYTVQCNNCSSRVFSSWLYIIDEEYVQLSDVVDATSPPMAVRFCLPSIVISHYNIMIWSGFGWNAYFLCRHFVGCVDDGFTFETYSIDRVHVFQVRWPRPWSNHAFDVTTSLSL